MPSLNPKFRLTRYHSISSCKNLVLKLPGWCPPSAIWRVIRLIPHQSKKLNLTHLFTTSGGFRIRVRASYCLFHKTLHLKIQWLGMDLRLQIKTTLPLWEKALKWERALSNIPTTQLAQRFKRGYKMDQSSVSSLKTQSVFQIAQTLSS